MCIADETSKAEKRAIGDYYFMGVSCTFISSRAGPHHHFTTADETSQREKRAIGDYYYMGAVLSSLPVFCEVDECRS